MKIRTYSELILRQTFIERFNYLKLNGIPGQDTFGYDRYLNQIFYNTLEWKHFRRGIIIRDNGQDLGCDNFEIFGKIIMHHITPITADDIKQHKSILFDSENLISTTLKTHNAIHYGDKSLLDSTPINRIKNDTCPWR